MIDIKLFALDKGSSKGILGSAPTLSGEIDWTAPRLLCIAGGFTRYDEHAVQQMNRNIELIRYRRFGENLLMLELVNAIVAEQVTYREWGGLTMPSLIAAHSGGVSS